MKMLLLSITEGFIIAFFIVLLVYLAVLGIKFFHFSDDDWE